MKDTQSEVTYFYLDKKGKEQPKLCDFLLLRDDEQIDQCNGFDLSPWNSTLHKENYTMETDENGVEQKDFYFVDEEENEAVIEF